MSVTARIDPRLPSDQNPHATKIAEIEAELDKLWPASRPKGGWRRKEPFAKAPIATLHRMKFLLKRRERLLCGFDVGVRIEVPDKRNPARCFAIADDPVVAELNPRNPVSPVAWSPPAASLLAFELQMPIERVEAALGRMPESYRSDAGVREWCRLVDAGVKSAIAAGGAPVKAESPVPAS